MARSVVVEVLPATSMASCPVSVIRLLRRLVAA
jgi:hypothetical protein